MSWLGALLQVGQGSSAIITRAEGRRHPSQQDFAMPASGKPTPTRPFGPPLGDPKNGRRRYHGRGTPTSAAALSFRAQRHAAVWARRTTRPAKSVRSPRCRDRPVRCPRPRCRQQIGVAGRRPGACAASCWIRARRRRHRDEADGLRLRPQSELLTGDADDLAVVGYLLAAAESPIHLRRGRSNPDERASKPTLPDGDSR